jgi:UDP-glucose:(heptosyl)LPS alpha-1,3-glucosyltransferase
MRLGILVRTLGTQGGTERYVHGLVQHLLALGHQPVVHAERVERPITGVELRPLDAAVRGRSARLQALDRAAGRVEPAGFDLLLGFFRGGRPELFRAGGGSHLAWMRRFPRPAWDLLGRQGDRVEAALDQAVLTQARLVVANSELCRRDLVEHSGLDPQKIALVRNGVDLERFSPSPLPRPPGPPRVLFLGNGWARKNLDAALAAAALLPEVQLLVAGREPRAGRWRRQAARLGLGARVRWQEEVERPEELLRGADLLLLPTRYDPCANVCLEAMACGLPVISTAQNGASELLPEPWMAVSDPEDAPGLAAAVERALQSPGLGLRCREAILPFPARASFDRLTGLAVDLAARTPR